MNVIRSKFFGLFILTVFICIYFILHQDWKIKDHQTKQKTDQNLDIKLKEIGQSIAINHLHSSFKVHPMIENIGMWYSYINAGVSAIDYNNDGLTDLFFCIATPGKANILYQNKGTHFEDVTIQVGLDQYPNTKESICKRPLFFDYNGDGLSDLFIGSSYCHRLFKQKQDGRFLEVTKESGMGDSCFYSAASNILDYDLDGDLDLVISGYLPKVNLLVPDRTLIMHNNLTAADNGGPTVFLRNNGDGTFTDIYPSLDLNLKGWVLSIGVYDLNYDTYPDLWFAIDFNKNRIYLNNKDGTFTEQTEKLISDFGYSGMSVDIEDIEHNKKPYAYISQIFFPGTKVTGNQLFQYSSRESYLSNFALDMKMNDCGWSWGGKFIDLNNDTHQELAVANGFISANPDKSYWYHLVEITAAGPTRHSDAKNWHPISDYTLAGHQANCLFLNDGKRFTNISSHSDFGYHKKDSRAIAKLDYNNDGILEMVVTNQEYRPFVYANKQRTANNWIGFNFKGRAFNPDLLGARVEIILDNGQVLTKQNYSSNGFISQSEPRVHFGLGTNKIKQIDIIYPKGHRETLDWYTINSYNYIDEY